MKKYSIVARWLMLLGGFGSLARGQGATLEGIVRSSDSTEPISYAVIELPDLHRDALGGATGAFRIGDLRAGPIHIRVRHLGYAPFDTVVSVADGARLLTVQLRRLAVSLDVMKVRASTYVHQGAGCPSPTDAAETATVLDLLEQVVTNARSYQALVNSHPFTSSFDAYGITRHQSGAVERHSLVVPEIAAPDHFELAASSKTSYAPGHVYRKDRSGSYEAFAPQLQDLGDSTFIASHCYALGGDTLVDSTRFVRVSFVPAPGVSGPDIEGTVTLRAADFSLTVVDYRTTGTPPSPVQKDITGVRIVTSYRNILPGIAVLSGLESFLSPGPAIRAKDSTIVSRGEQQQLVGIRWKKGPP